ncbi:hypothetical protein Tco_1559181, partial [Tanacetum coccineum]
MVTEPLAGIKFRKSEGDEDMHNHVFRWDKDPIESVFECGFNARHQGDTLMEIYYNLHSFVHSAVKLLERIRDTNYAFVSTTLGASWSPMVSGLNEQFTKCIKANNIFYLNKKFKPQFDPEKEIKIRRPTTYYWENNKMKRLVIEEISRQISLTMEER